MSSNVTRRAWLQSAGAAALAPYLAPVRMPAAKVAESKPIRGAFMILSTPYTSARAVDYEDLAGEVDFLDRIGIHGIVWPQLSSEYARLTKEERMQGMEVIARAARGKRPALVLGVQGDDTPAMLEYAEHAEKLEPDAFIAIPPRSARSLDDYHQYFTALAKLTRRPIFIQTTGGAPNLEPNVDFIISMAREYPNLGYVKEETEPVIPRMKKLMENRPNPVTCVFGANFGVGFPYQMRLGIDGTMTGGVMYAEAYARMWKLHQEGKFDQERDLFSKLLLMINLDHQIPGVRLYILRKRGIFKTSVSRQGDYSFTADQIAEIEHNFAALEPWLKA